MINNQDASCEEAENVEFESSWDISFGTTALFLFSDPINTSIIELEVPDQLKGLENDLKNTYNYSIIIGNITTDLEPPKDLESAEIYTADGTKQVKDLLAQIHGHKVVVIPMTISGQTPLWVSQNKGVSVIALEGEYEKILEIWEPRLISKGELLWENSDGSLVKRHLTKSLPLILGGASLEACPDSGAAFNAIDINLAGQLNCKVEEVHPGSTSASFQLPTFQQKIKPVGKTKISCQFPKESDTRKDYEFYVFDYLVNPLIIGNPFLRITQTLRKYSHRLKKCVRPQHSYALVRCLGTETEKLYCNVEGKPVLCVADTGAEVNIMSPSYAVARGFEIDYSTRGYVKFADGTIQKTLGRVDARISLGKSVAKERFESFEILEGLDIDVVLGGCILWEEDAFNRHASSFDTDSTSSGGFDLGPIAFLGTLEEAIIGGLEKLISPFKRRKRRKGRRGRKRGLKYKRGTRPEPEIENSEPQYLRRSFIENWETFDWDTYMEMIDDMDTEEMNRRIREDLLIQGLPDSERSRGEEIEAWRRARYERHRNGLAMSASNLRPP